jgi:hypothetical protein
MDAMQEARTTKEIAPVEFFGQRLLGSASGHGGALVTCKPAKQPHRHAALAGNRQDFAIKYQVCVLAPAFSILRALRTRHLYVV